MKKYLLFFLYGLLLFPAVASAKEGKDSLGITQSFIGKNYSSNFSYKNYLKGRSEVSQLSENTVAHTKKKWFKAMSFSGYARFYTLYRNMNSYYNIAPSQGLTLPVNLTVGDGYQQPLMLFRMEARPSPKTWFQMELQFDHRLLTKATTPISSDTSGRLASLYVIFQLEGTWETSIGKFKLTAGGGANWFRISPSTLWGYQYRDDLFDRYPWEPEGHDFSRYNSAYSSGDIPRDARFGMQATQGFILQGTNLPKGFNASVLFGKTQTGGGYQSYLSKTPQNVFAGRVDKTIGEHKIGVNYYNQFGYTGNQVLYQSYYAGQGTDSFFVEKNRTSQIVASLDGRFEFKKFSLYTEMGAGSYLSNKYNAGLKDHLKVGVDHASRYKRNWGETMFLEITTKREWTRIPLKLALYRIDRNVVNNNSSVSNTSVEEAKPNTGVPDQFYVNYYDGMVTDIGQLANNRQGLNFSATKKINKLSAKLDFGIAQEIKNLVGDIRNGARANSLSGGAPVDSLSKVPFTNSITFEHRLNGTTRSRFAFYERFTGPYHRIHSIFRRTYENIAITDTIVNYKKSFNSMDLELKYKFRVFGKELIVTNFSIFSSVQDHWSPIPVVTDKAFLRIFYSELMAFYAVHPKLTMVGFLGIERVKGNNRTELADANGKLITNATGRPVADPNGKAVDQTGYGYGLGLDYNFHTRASINVRGRWFSHQDKNFILDKFKGVEVTTEFKVFF